MKIELITDWGGAVKGTVLPICEEVGNDLVSRKIAKEITDKTKNSAQKGAGNGGKDGKK